MKDQIKGTILACIRDDILDPCFEISFGYIFALPKIVMLLSIQYEVLG